MSSTAAGSPTGSTRTPEVRVRPATLEDAEAIERIRVETWRATYQGLLPDGLIDGLRENPDGRRERLRAQPADQFSFVAEDAGQVVAFAVGGRERSGDPAHRGEVYAIYVLPAHQGKGLGRALIRQSAHELATRGLDSLLIWVLRENTIGRRFYERLGGRAIREKPLEEFPGAADHIEIAYGWSDTSPLR